MNSCSENTNNSFTYTITCVPSNLEVTTLRESPTSHNRPQRLRHVDIECYVGLERKRLRHKQQNLRTAARWSPSRLAWETSAQMQEYRYTDLQKLKSQVGIW